MENTIRNEEKMQAIYDAALPGFYKDARGAYGIVVGRVYICCFINDDGSYDVTADTVDKNGDFALNLDWESYDTPKEAVAQLRHRLKHFANLSSTF